MTYGSFDLLIGVSFQTMKDLDRFVFECVRKFVWVKGNGDVACCEVI